MYQSLHTTVLGPDGERVELEIRTEEMHRIAEEGIAAHWRYKEQTPSEKHDERFAWLRRLLEWQQDVQDPIEFMETVKIDMFRRRSTSLPHAVRSGLSPVALHGGFCLTWCIRTSGINALAPGQRAHRAAAVPVA